MTETTKNEQIELIVNHLAFSTRRIRGLVARIAVFYPAVPSSNLSVGGLIFEVIFICNQFFFSKCNQFDLIKWTVSISIFNISIKLYDPLNILCWLGQEKSKKKSAAYVAEQPLFLDSFLKLKIRGL